MLNIPQLGQQTTSHYSHHQAAVLLLQKPFINGSWNINGSFAAGRGPCLFPKKQKSRVRVRLNKQPSSTKKVAASDPTEIAKSVDVKAVVTIQLKVGGLLSSIGIKQARDTLTDFLGKSLLLELVSTELDPQKRRIKAYVHKIGQDKNVIKYESSFEIPADFGTAGGVLVENEHHNEMFLKDIVLEFPDGPAVNFTCNSWLHSKYDNPHKRLFFSNKKET